MIYLNEIVNYMLSWVSYSLKIEFELQNNFEKDILEEEGLFYI
jgi:hypothetical protein